MRNRILNDLGSSMVRSRDVSSLPMMSRNVSPAPMMGSGLGDLDNEGNDMSPSRLRYVSESHMRERGSKSPMSMRTKFVSKSPVRRLDGNICNSINENYGEEQEGMGYDFVEEEEEVRSVNMSAKDSFNLCTLDDNHGRDSNYNYQGRRRMWGSPDGAEADKISGGNEHGMTLEGSVDDSVHVSAFNKGRLDRDQRVRGDYVKGNVRPRVNADHWYTGTDVDGVNFTNSRIVVECGMASASSNSFDETSNNHIGYIHGYGHTRHNYDGQRGSNNTHHLDRHDFVRRPKQFSEMDESYFEEERKRFRVLFHPDNNILSRSHLNHGPGHYERSPLYDDPFMGQMKRDCHPEMPHYPRHSRMGYDRQGRDRPSTSAYGMPLNHGPHPNIHSMNLERHVPWTYGPRRAYTGPQEQPPQLDSHHARRGTIKSQNKRLCLPIAGGSPFVLCHNCFELLKLPGKFTTKHKKEYQLQCGACSCIMSLNLQNRFVGVLSPQKKPDAVYDAASGFDEVLNRPSSRHRRDSNVATSTSLESYDFDATGSTFPSMEFSATEESRRQGLTSTFDEKVRDISPSSRSSKEYHVSDSASVRSSPQNSSEMPLKIRPPPGSPLRDHLDYSNHFFNIGADNAGYHIEKEKQVLEKSTSQDSLMVNAIVPSEIEVYSHELSPSFTFSDSGEVTTENKDGNKDNSYVCMRSFASKSGRASPEVYVNGQQLPPHVVKKAEKLAGPIEPGDYWYDPKAGFWGVMGECCGGIIPPSIQEFSLPMTENCSQGDTSIYVNGRELQKRDLDLLTKRGFPTMKHKRYIIDTSGKVIEEQSKDFIVNLGKLAPTVERNKRGFGMRVPERFDV